MRKIYIWLPLILTIYFLFMTFRFGIHLLEEGESIKFWLTVIGEVAVLVLLYFVLRKRQDYRDRREKDVEK